MSDNKNEESGGSVGAGSQTLMRGLDILEAVSEEGLALAELSERIGLAKSTTYRLATALADRGYLAYTPRAGYRLGAKLLQLGAMAQAQIDLIQVSRDHLERLSSSTGDTVHMGVLDGDQALYLDKVPGRRRITISSRVGDRQPLSSTGLGKALMLDHAPTYWAERFERDQQEGSHPIDPALWRDRMASYAEAGRAYDLEENEDQIRCVAAPIRDVAGKIVGAISVSSAAQYMDDQRMVDLTAEVMDTARSISAELGWSPPRS
jgi:DNA-binding IclR family transcriptional regulator